MQTYKNTDPKQRQVIGNFLDMFHLSITVDDFCNEGVVVKDLNGRTVAPCYGELREDMIHVGKPYAEIMVIGLDDGMFVGWVRAAAMVDAGDRYLVPVKTLNKLPRIFDFVQPCPHLSVYGGVSLPGSELWECLGCGQEIVVR
jgi:hypothetical protein